MKKILMIAFHYPPFRGSSGVQRTLKFSRYLLEYGWQPLILTAHAKAYPQVGDDLLHEIPDDVPVTRAFALDAARHLGFRGSYFQWTAQPDRWISWWLGAVPAALRLIHRYRPDVIWSTHPIPTAHLIGLTLRRLTGLPWVVDFRDSMLEEEYPRDSITRRSYQWIEMQAALYGCRLIFTTESTRRMYLDRYRSLPPERCLVIPNGYDEEDFKDLLVREPTKNFDERPVRLLHAGVIYPDERDPRAFFMALSRLKKDHLVDAERLTIDLRASGSEAYYSEIIQTLDIDDLVHLLPAVPYRDALQECADADALILFQAASCNHLIPAKVYEYLRLKKPILALTVEQGDTAILLREMGGATIADLTDEQAIYRTLPAFLSAIRNGTHPLPDNQKSQRYARKNQAYDLAQCLVQLLKAAPLS